MCKRLRLLAAGLAFAAAAAHADVAESTSSHLSLKYTIKVKVAPDKAFAAFVQIGNWWDPAHSYSNSGANLKLDARAGGCWCEKLADGGSVEHMRVVLVLPGKLIRLTGGLGPLQSGNVAGNMTWAFKKSDDGTEITVGYLVDGWFPGGLDTIAAGVDGVLGAQVHRYESLINTGKPT